VTVLAERPIRRWHALAKAGMDYTLGGIATLALLPALGAIALAIRLDDPGPVLFKQRRHGYNNREFEIYKFRTMRLGANKSADAIKQTERDDPRITRVGRFLRKWSLDELPQLFNVLRGEMSLVGPRPHAVVMRTEQRLGEEIVAAYPHRHRVKPGITGWAQVHGARGATDTEAQLRRRIELDLYYIEHCSPLLDFKVLLLTCREVLRATNAY
jgi:exopolysaccharide biosynthesis polyprenyl glycosylphosphotransferase